VGANIVVGMEIGRKGLQILNQANPSGAPSLQPLRLSRTAVARGRELRANCKV
jgi:hypothetical protein